jgi:hypothetical protein
VSGLRGGQVCRVTSGFSIKVRWKSCNLEGNRLERQRWDRRSVNRWGDRTVVDSPKGEFGGFLG